MLMITTVTKTSTISSVQFKMVSMRSDADVDNKGEENIDDDHDDDDDQFSSVQFKMVSMRCGRPICAPPSLSGVSPMLPFKTVPMLV